MSQEKNQNIVIFSTAYLPFVGGVELAIKAITDRISTANFFLITSRLRRDLPQEEKIGNVLVCRVGVGFSFDRLLLPIVGFFKFFRLYSKFKLRDSKFILWGMMASYGSIAAYFIKLFKPSAPFLLTLQEGDPETHLKYGKLGLVGFFGKRIIKKADRIQVISEYLKNFAVSRGAKNRIDVVPNGVDILNFSRNFSETEKARLRERLNIKLNDKIIISVSRLAYKNGLDVLLRSVKAASAPAIKVILAGEGGDERNLKNLSRELGIEDKVIFLGTIPNKDLPFYFSISDIFVRPSRSEGLGTSFLEAMAAGIPVIASAVGGIPDFLKDYQTGLFANVDDVDDLARKIKILLENDELRKSVTANARELVNKNYDWSAVSSKMESIFENL